MCFAKLLTCRGCKSEESADLTLNASTIARGTQLLEIAAVGGAAGWTAALSRAALTSDQLQGGIDIVCALPVQQ